MIFSINTSHAIFGTYTKIIWLLVWNLNLIGHFVFLPGNHTLRVVVSREKTNKTEQNFCLWISCSNLITKMVKNMKTQGGIRRKGQIYTCNGRRINIVLNNLPELCWWGKLSYREVMNISNKGKVIIKVNPDIQGFWFSCWMKRRVYKLTYD